MAAPIYLLLPPSEGKKEGGARGGAGGTFDATLAKERTSVRRGLRQLLGAADDARLSSVLKVRGPLLERAKVASRQLVVGRAPLLVAWERYEGVVWQHLDPATLGEEQRQRILVPSALYGVTLATDVVADYRLTFSVSLPGLGNLARYWSPSVTSAVATHCRGAMVVDLLPAEHAGALDLDALATSVRLERVRFTDASGARVVGHDAKAAKGAFARHLLDHGWDARAGFCAHGWKATVDPSGRTVVHAPN